MSKHRLRGVNMLFPSEYIYVLNIAVVLMIAIFAYSGYRRRWQRLSLYIRMI